MATENSDNLKRWILTVEEDPDTGDAVILLPPELLCAAGWQEGDVLTWQDQKDGSWTLQKQEPLAHEES
jgi:hypothetical protein